MSKKNIIILVIAVALVVLGVFFINTRDSKNVVEAPSVEKPIPTTTRLPPFDLLKGTLS